MIHCEQQGVRGLFMRPDSKGGMALYKVSDVGRRLSSEANRRLGKLGIDEIVRIRVSAKGRLFALRDGDVFDLLWWDPEHQVYPTEPRRT